MPKPDQSQAPFRQATRPLRLVVAGGGTGGHLFAGIAVAEVFMARQPGNRVLFVSTGNRFERRVLARCGFPLASVPIEGIKGRGRRQQLSAALKIPGALLQSLRILRAFRPDLVLGVGSYAAGPVVLAARLLGCKIALHEQNLLPGITNRLLVPLADRFYVSFADTRRAAGRTPVRVTGNPVRRAIRELAARPAAAVAPPDRPLRVLVAGGSQGAHSINQAVLAALDSLPDPSGITWVHQTGAQDAQAVARAFAARGLSARVQAFFEDIAAQYGAADLLICRAGATTVAEITAIGKAAVFVPFPFAADNHQQFNAQALVAAGAAEMILERDLTGALLARKLQFYRRHREALAAMAARARELGRADAAQAIVADCCHLIGAHTAPHSKG
ncbi:MAG: undecaprenyldiphospho-muramoylpentapeptide beta-N-acetylglucosaminyltransferase [Desulfobacteraceae bacterium]|nr:undecaprenyldiphospho-muramoylpentapeptide beta-N-acetylglucosaminyltransferase [Desulfobacteraceae bacterium]